VTRAADDSPPERVVIESLRRRSDFDRVFRTGRRAKVGGVVVIAAPGMTSSFRHGLVVGRKVGGAVERNRVKRRLRSALRAASPPAGVDAVVIGSKSVTDVDFRVLIGWLKESLAGGTRRGS